MLNAEVRRAPTLVHNSLAHHVPSFLSRPLVLIYESIASAICIHSRLALPMHGPPVSFRTYTAAPLASVLPAAAAAVSRIALLDTPFFASPSSCGVGYTHSLLFNTTSSSVRCRRVIRPVREVLRPVPARPRTCLEALLAPRQGPAASGTVADIEQPAAAAVATAASQGRTLNRLATVLSLPPLRTAFGEFCRKSLCSEVRMYVLLFIYFRGVNEVHVLTREARRPVKWSFFSEPYVSVRVSFWTG